MRILKSKKKILLGLIFIILLGFIGITIKNNLYQISLQPFYKPPSLNEHKPGDILRIEPLITNLPQGTKAYRMLYVSEFANGEKNATSGMIFIPKGTAPTNGRKIVVWAHGTLGMGDNCAPSRDPDTLINTPWLTQMLQEGWIVTTTDYYGLGTPGVERYLVGEDQSRDVLNSIRAARKIPNANAGTEFAIWGHSQGGQAALFAANAANTYLPDMKLIAVATGAPAAELPELMSEHYSNIAISWIIGSQMALGWQAAYPEINFLADLTDEGKTNYETLAKECITMQTIQGLIRQTFRQQFFSQNPIQLPSWKKILQKNIPSSLTPNIPLLIVQSLSDQVVLPDTTKLYIQNSCKNSSAISTHWLNNVSHQDTAIVAGGYVTSWLADRFRGVKPQNDCPKKLLANPEKN